MAIEDSEQKIYILMTGLEQILDTAIISNEPLRVDIIKRVHFTFKEAGICRNCRGRGEARGFDGGVEGYHKCFSCKGTGEAK